MRRCRLIVLASVAGLIIAAGDARGQTSTRPKRVLLLGQTADGHPATTHEYMAGVQLLANLLSRQPSVQTVVIQADSPWREGPELLDGADGAVLYLSEGAKWVSDDADRLAAFQRLAKRGGGLTCLHWGMGTKAAEPIREFAALWGGCHGGPDRKYKVVSVTASTGVDKHPILSGINPFEVHDEFYYALKQPAPERVHSIAPLLTVPIDGSTETVAWACERLDGGRSFGFSGLHFHSNWKLSEYRRLVLQGIVWTLNNSIPQPGLPVDLPDTAFDIPAQSKVP